MWCYAVFVVVFVMFVVQHSACNFLTLKNTFLFPDCFSSVQELPFHFPHLNEHTFWIESKLVHKEKFKALFWRVWAFYMQPICNAILAVIIYRYSQFFLKIWYLLSPAKLPAGSRMTKRANPRQIRHLKVLI